MDYKELRELADRLEKRYKGNETGSTFVTLCSRRDVLNAANAITDLLNCMEDAEARAEKAERERDAAVEEIPKICYYCKHRKGWKVCSDYSGNEKAETCKKWEWRGQKEE